jgi:hypothetical protein
MHSVTPSGLQGPEKRGCQAQGFRSLCSLHPGLFSDASLGRTGPAASNRPRPQPRNSLTASLVGARGVASAAQHPDLTVWAIFNRSFGVENECRLPWNRMNHRHQSW